jgi:hypothetical protein
MIGEIGMLPALVYALLNDLVPSQLQATDTIFIQAGAATYSEAMTLLSYG